MKPILSVGRCLAVTLLAGCTGMQAGLTPSGLAMRPASPPLAVTLQARRDTARSWMMPEAKKRSLLYVSDDISDNVYVFSYPKGKLVGTLAGFSAPGGLCTDSRGDVFVPDVFMSTIEEFAHGGTNPIATLSDAPFSYPNSCDVNHTNGDLAVGNNASGIDGEGRGGIAIFRRAAGTPSFHEAMYHPYSCGYDPDGNLFVDGEGVGFKNFKFGEIPANDKHYRKIALHQQISLAGGVVWDGTSVAVGDVNGAAIYRFTVNGLRAKRVGSTTLPGTTIAWEFKVAGGKVVVPDYVLQHQGSSVIFLYDYPAGGAAVKTIGAGVVVDPVGVAISQPP